MTNEIEPKKLWNKNPNNPTMGRFLNNGGTFGAETDLEIAQLDYLHKISGNLETIRFRVGFLSLVVLISLVIIPFFVFISFIGAFAP